MSIKFNAAQRMYDALTPEDQEKATVEEDEATLADMAEDATERYY